MAYNTKQKVGKEKGHWTVGSVAAGDVGVPWQTVLEETVHSESW